MSAWIEQLCVAAKNHNASDIYILEEAIPQLRISGSWTPVGDQALPVEEIDSFWKQCGCDESTLDKDCGFVSEIAVRFRVNLFRSLGRRGAVLRQIKTEIPHIQTLGLPSAQLISWIERKSGIMLVTGRTGSGKSTTLAACLDWLNDNMQRHVITIEDPIEFLFEPRQCLFSQREVGLDTPSFAEGLRRALRQSPDVIMVGEIRDAASARTAFQAAETGHLVMASVHSQNVPETIERIIQLFPQDERESVLNLMGAQVSGILSQYLAPASKGGLTLVCEYMENGALTRKWIREGKTTDLADLIAKGDKREMQGFLPALVERCKAGDIAESDALAIAPNAQEFTRLMRGISAGSGSLRR